MANVAESTWRNNTGEYIYNSESSVYRCPIKTFFSFGNN